MNIVITGANGFLGSYLYKKLKSNHNVMCFDILTDVNPNCKVWDITKSLDKKIKADVVIHAAAKVDNYGKYSDFFNTNVIGTRNVISSIEHSKFVYISSSSIYVGSKDPMPYKEEYSNLNPLNNYAKTKLLAEKEVIEKSKNYYILRPRLLYGEGKNPVEESLLKNKILNRIILPGSGKELTSATNLETIFRVIQEIIDNQIPQGIYNVSDKKIYSIKELMQILATKYNLKETKFLYILKLEIIAKPINFFSTLFRKRSSLDSYAISNLTKNNTLDISKIEKFL